MGQQTTGGTTAGHRAGAVAMLQRAPKPPADQPRRPPGTDDLAMAFKPHFTGGITGQVTAFGIGQQRTHMQARSALLNIEVHHHRGVLPVWAAGRLGVPAGLDQTHKRLGSARHRRPLT
ncbi:hypothetical protein A5623_05210 [Mycobacterium colombiense]|nr:hypothetical protein A5623_05210 [Mycobacterium colombiense]